jgi:hypothetical protein
MNLKQNPTAKGSRVLWNSLVDASTESLTPLAQLVQTLVAGHHVRPELAVTIAVLAFGGSAHHG